jgi:hypothetical protein
MGLVRVVPQTSCKLRRNREELIQRYWPRLAVDLGVAFVHVRWELGADLET